MTDQPDTRDLAQQLRDANTGEAWAAERGIPFERFAQVAVKALAAAGWRPPASSTEPTGFITTTRVGREDPAETERWEQGKALPGTVRGLGIALQRLERRVDQLEDRLSPPTATVAEPDPPFCHRCGHACGHNPPHRLVDTPRGPVCEDEAWCTQLRHADEARRARDARPDAEMVWLGDLSGFQIDLDNGGDIMLRHRCGWTYEISNPVRAYLANLIDGPVAAHRDAGCNPHED